MLVTDDDGVPGTASVVSAAAAVSSVASSTQGAVAASTSENVGEDSGSAAVGRTVRVRALWMIAGGITGVVAWLA